MMVKNIKEELQKLDKRNYLMHQLDPKFNDLQYMRSHIYKNHMELHKLNEENFGEKIKINYEDIVKLDIDKINIYIELKNGTSYFLKVVGVQ
ncbi:hypothetical protein ACSVC9_12080 [Clostridium sp. LBM24168]